MDEPGFDSNNLIRSGAVIKYDTIQYNTVLNSAIQGLAYS